MSTQTEQALLDSITSLFIGGQWIDGETGGLGVPEPLVQLP